MIGGHNLSNKRYADDTVLIEDWEVKLKELLDKGKREEKSINYKKTECVVISKIDIHIGDVKITQVEEFNYPGNMAIDNEM